MVNHTMILAAETEGLSRLFDLDFQLLADTVLMIIAMFVLFLVASHFLFNPVRKMLNDRKEKIRGELDQAAADQKSAADTRALYEEKLSQAGKEAEAILADARKRGMENEDGYGRHFVRDDSFSWLRHWWALWFGNKITYLCPC